MTGRLPLVPHSFFLNRAFIKPALAMALVTIPMISWATPANMGTFTVTNATGSSASGTYITANGDTGTFTLMRDEMIGYQANATFTPSRGNSGANGIEVKNDSNTNVNNDKFKYTFSITPTNINAIHTIKVGQASYATTGNSEIARQTLGYTKNPLINAPAEAIIQENSSVRFYYEAMGDYFMGKKVDKQTLSSPNAVSEAQLRTDNSATSRLYYYNIPSLVGATNPGTSGTPTPYKPTLDKDKQVSLSPGPGVLPPTPTFDNILKSTADPSSFSALSPNTRIANGGSYVSYGIENSVSSYVMAVKNAATVTLTYEGIMNGNIGISRPVIGETYSEWISFGVSSEPKNVIKYFFSGNVFNDNGGISDAQSSASNATINTGVYNNASYFNGVLNRTSGGVNEEGISGSTVKLIDCDNPNTIYDQRTLSPSATNIGFYQVSIDEDLIRNKTKLCITEENTSAQFPVRTNSNKIEVNLIPGNYYYENNNFGRVSTKNAALVLEKEQAANNCNFTDFTKLKYSKNPLSSSTTGVGADIRPGQCIAYKVTATNRAHVDIGNFVMRDTLQKKDPNNPNSAPITSFLADPARISADFADTLTKGQNGTIVTKSINLLKRQKRIFYFNTQYGTTQSE